LERACSPPGCFVRAGTYAAYQRAHHNLDARSVSAALCTAALGQAAQACPDGRVLLQRHSRAVPGRTRAAPKAQSCRARADACCSKGTAGRIPVRKEKSSPKWH
jgi:hypothetical protein